MKRFRVCACPDSPTRSLGCVCAPLRARWESAVSREATVTRLESQQQQGDLRVDPAHRPEPRGEPHCLGRSGDLVRVGGHPRPAAAHPAGGAGGLPRRVLQLPGRAGRAGGSRRGPADRFPAQPRSDLRPARHPAALLRAAVHHHGRHPARPGRGLLGAPGDGARRHGHVPVRIRRPDRRGRERQLGHGRLHQPGAGRAPCARGNHERRAGRSTAGGCRPRASDPPGRQPPLPSHPAHVADHVRRSRAPDVRPQHAGGVLRADGGLPGVRGAVRHLHHAAAGADRVLDTRRPAAAAAAAVRVLTAAAVRPRVPTRRSRS